MLNFLDSKRKIDAALVTFRPSSGRFVVRGGRYKGDTDTLLQLTLPRQSIVTQKGRTTSEQTVCPELNLYCIMEALSRYFPFLTI